MLFDRVRPIDTTRYHVTIINMSYRLGLGLGLGLGAYMAAGASRARERPTRAGGERLGLGRWVGSVECKDVAA